MAAAMVSGTAALMIDADPTAAGAGVLDITAALAETGTLTSALSPRMGRSDEGAVIITAPFLWSGMMKILASAISFDTPFFWWETEKLAARRRPCRQKTWTRERSAWAHEGGKHLTNKEMNDHAASTRISSSLLCDRNKVAAYALL